MTVNFTAGSQHNSPRVIEAKNSIDLEKKSTVEIIDLFMDNPADFPMDIQVVIDALKMDKENVRSHFYVWYILDKLIAYHKVDDKDILHIWLAYAMGFEAADLEEEIFYHMFTWALDRDIPQDAVMNIVNAIMDVKPPKDHKHYCMKLFMHVIDKPGFPDIPKIQKMLVEFFMRTISDAQHVGPLEGGRMIHYFLACLDFGFADMSLALQGLSLALHSPYCSLLHCEQVLAHMYQIFLACNSTTQGIGKHYCEALRFQLDYSQESDSVIIRDREILTQQHKIALLWIQRMGQEMSSRQDPTMYHVLPYFIHHVYERDGYENFVQKESEIGVHKALVCILKDNPEQYKEQLFELLEGLLVLDGFVEAKRALIQYLSPLYRKESLAQTSVSSRPGAMAIEALCHCKLTEISAHNFALALDPVFSLFLEDLSLRDMFLHLWQHACQTVDDVGVLNNLLEFGCRTLYAGPWSDDQKQCIVHTALNAWKRKKTSLCIYFALYYMRYLSSSYNTFGDDVIWQYNNRKEDIMWGAEWKKQAFLDFHSL